MVSCISPASSDICPLGADRDITLILTPLNYRMNRRKADFKFAYKFLEDDV